MTFRSTRPTTASLLGLLALVAALVAVPAGTASAAADAVTLSTATPVVRYGSGVTFRAVVTSAGAPVPAVNVALWRTGSDGVETFVDYAETDAAGAAVLVDPNAVAHPTYTARTDFPDRVVSAPVVVDVAYAVVPFEQTSFFAPTLLSPVAVPPGGRITLQGKVAPAGSTTPLDVEQRFGAGAWEPLGTVPVAADGTFSLALGPRSKVGTWTVRATHPAEGGLVAGEGEATAKVTVTGVGRRTAWRPIAGTKKAPARWGTCRIRYKVNERRMPATGMADLREAMRRVTQVTGIRFRYRGRTSALPQGSYGGPGLDKMVVAWAPPAKSGGLLVDGVGGVGGTSRTASRLLSGYVLMNSDYATKAEPGFGAGQPLGLVLMHELGHVVGLDHATDAKQIMAPGSPLPAAVWGAADLNGLRHVGARCR
jgi:hypothetical protein